VGSMVAAWRGVSNRKEEMWEVGDCCQADGDVVEAGKAEWGVLWVDAVGAEKEPG